VATPASRSGAAGHLAKELDAAASTATQASPLHDNFTTVDDPMRSRPVPSAVHPRDFLQSTAAIGGTLLLPAFHLAAAPGDVAVANGQGGRCVYGATSGGVVLPLRWRSRASVLPRRARPSISAA